MRLDKFICKSTHLSLSEAQLALVSQRVAVNGQVPQDPKMQVHENNTVELDGKPLKARPFRYIMLHKPAATVCSNIDEAYPSVFNCLDIEHCEELHIAGRLDADTTGMVLITDDGRWSFNITRPEQHCPKVYRVDLAYELKPELSARFEQGIQLQGEALPCQAAHLQVLAPKQVLLTITEGKFHQVKRMFASVGNKVLALHRQQIAALELDVAEGQWRYLSAAEVKALRP